MTINFRSRVLGNSRTSSNGTQWLQASCRSPGEDKQLGDPQFLQFASYRDALEQYLLSVPAEH